MSGSSDPRRPEKQQRYKPPPANNAAAPGEDLTPDYMNILDSTRKASQNRSDRFKVVKIECTKPFKRGRWECMDFLDQSYDRIAQYNSVTFKSNNNTELNNNNNNNSNEIDKSNLDINGSMLDIFFRQNSTGKFDHKMTEKESSSKQQIEFELKKPQQLPELVGCAEENHHDDQNSIVDNMSSNQSHYVQGDATGKNYTVESHNCWQQSTNNVIQNQEHQNIIINQEKIITSNVTSTQPQQSVNYQQQTYKEVTHQENYTYTESPKQIFKPDVCIQPNISYQNNNSQYINQNIAPLNYTQQQQPQQPQQQPQTPNNNNNVCVTNKATQMTQNYQEHVVNQLLPQNLNVLPCIKEEKPDPAAETMGIDQKLMQKNEHVMQQMQPELINNNHVPNVNINNNSEQALPNGSDTRNNMSQTSVGFPNVLSGATNIEPQIFIPYIPNSHPVPFFINPIMPMYYQAAASNMERVVSETQLFVPQGSNVFLRQNASSNQKKPVMIYEQAFENAVQDSELLNIAKQDSNQNSVDIKIEALMDLVTKHLKLTILEDINAMKQKISTLKERVTQLELENELLRRSREDFTTKEHGK